ncbi:MAG: hypothetical protein WDM71_07015 [Ferruginibacter sp.]
MPDEPTHRLNEDGASRILNTSKKYPINFAMYEGLNDSHGGSSYDF